MQLLFSLQIVLKAGSGINYVEFYNFLHNISRKRLAVISDVRKSVPCKHETLGHKHDTPPEVEDGEDSRLCIQSCDKTLKPGIPCMMQYSNSSSEKCDQSNARPYYDNLTVNHAIFDLIQAKTVLTDMIENEEFLLLDMRELAEAPSQVLTDINEQLAECLQNI